MQSEDARSCCVAPSRGLLRERKGGLRISTPDYGPGGHKEYSPTLAPSHKIVRAPLAGRKNLQHALEFFSSSRSG
jgi:hypothetical protein